LPERGEVRPALVSRPGWGEVLPASPPRSFRAAAGSLLPGPWRADRRSAFLGLLWAAHAGSSPAVLARCGPPPRTVRMTWAPSPTRRVSHPSPGQVSWLADHRPRRLPIPRWGQWPLPGLPAHSGAAAWASTPLSLL